MADNLTFPKHHFNMSHIHGKDTSIELLVRKRLHAAGFRYRLNVKELPGKPDILLPKYRTVVFIHGCFWHGHKGCKKYVVPKTNADYWINKVSRNQERDEKVWRDLEAKGWAVVIVWECELEKKCFDATINRVEKEIRANGEEYQRRKEERRQNRQQRILERRERACRYEKLIAEIDSL